MSRSRYAEAVARMRDVISKKRGKIIKEAQHNGDVSWQKIAYIPDHAEPTYNHHLYHTMKLQ